MLLHSKQKCETGTLENIRIADTMTPATAVPIISERMNKGGKLPATPYIDPCTSASPIPVSTTMRIWAACVLTGSEPSMDSSSST